jgi:hypothetical protein
MTQRFKRQLLSFGREMAVYAVLVTGYVYLVLHYLGAWLYHLFQSERKTYAVVSLLAVVIQGVLLERLTAVLLHLLKLDKGGPE